MKVDLSKFNLRNKKVAVALSGGADSMCLLHYLLSVSENYGFTVCAVNVEHGIRGKESLRDTNFVKDYCLKNGITLFTYSVNAVEFAKTNKLSLEQGARILRYQAFDNALKENKCDIIATAHHLGDNLETVLFNLFRGTGLKGIAGINDERKNVIRPFISLSKKEILDYVDKNDIPFVTDSTNFNDNYTRNNLRINVIPKIKELFPKVEQSALRLSEIAREEDEFLDTLALSHVEKVENGYKINLPLDNVLIKRATVKILNNLGISKDWEKKHLEDVVSLSKNKVSKSINLLKGINVIKEYNSLFFTALPLLGKNFELPYTTQPFTKNGITYNFTVLKKEETDLSKLNLKEGLFFDGDKIPLTAVIRSRKEGDVFTKFGGKTKKLNDYFTDVKIPLKDRNDIPLICDGKNVLAILNFAISNSIKVDNDTKIIIQLN